MAIHLGLTPLNKDESKVVELLKANLDDNWRIFNNIIYMDKEIDIVLFNPFFGIISFEVKGWIFEQISDDLSSKIKEIYRDSFVKSKKIIELLNNSNRDGKLPKDPKGNISIPVTCGIIFPNIPRDQFAPLLSNKVLENDNAFRSIIFGDDLISPDLSNHLLKFSKNFPFEIAQLTQRQIEIIENIFYKRVDVKKYTVKSIEHLEKIKFFDTNFLLSKGKEILEKLKNGDVFVNGVAGSGKTILLLYAAINLAVNNPDSNILLTFNTFSMAKTIRRYFNEITTLMPDLKVEYEQKIKEINIAQIKSASNLTNLNYILIDEAQDLSSNRSYWGYFELQNSMLKIKFDKRLHKLLSKNPNARCVFAYDPSQIFYSDYSFLYYKYDPSTGMYVKRNPDQVKTQTLVLNKSYRNTYEILSLANKLRSYFEKDLSLDLVTQIDLDFAPRRGIFPELIKVDREDFPSLIIKKIKEISKEYNLNNYSQFAIITPSTSYADIIGYTFKDENIPYVIFRENLDEKGYSNLPDDAVVISDGARAKGNGWDVVFLIIDRDEKLKYLYTCITRAETYLFILYFEENNTIKLIKEILKHNTN